MSIEITNWDEFRKEVKKHVAQKFKGAGFLVEGEIRREIEKMHLMGTPPNLWQRGYQSSVETNGNEVSLVIETGLPYAVYLEYGTYEYYNAFGMTSFPSTPDKKKKNMPAKERKNYPKGMTPFAPLRRVLWNEQKMQNILSKVFK